MKKSWVLGLFVLMVSGVCLKVWADGSFVNAPGPIIAANGQNYNYPAAPSTNPGGLLVNDGVGTYRYSNAVITTTTSLVSLQFPVMPLITKGQELVLPSATTGQFALCTDCLNSGSGKGSLCYSTGTVNVGSFVNVSSGTACQ